MVCQARKNERGSALLPVMLLGVAGLAVSAGLLAHSGSESERARRTFKAKETLSCAESGLQYARLFFGRNYPLWDTYLSAANIAKYNIMTTNVAGSALAAADLTNTSEVAAMPQELFGDIDGDGVNDFQIYMRDDVDEFPDNDPTKDNNQRVIIGATCITKRLQAANEFTGSMAMPGVEAILVYASESATGQ
ncbi:MAG: hypothetical protein HY901_14825 [Deltaproteobacteria bacterium]|nr:hypothetical protein [Deltaproteobacteria bacterium]